MSNQTAKEYVASHLTRSPRDAGWTLEMPKTLTKYDRGGGTKYDFVKPMGESHTVVLFMAELMYEFEAEIARRS